MYNVSKIMKQAWRNARSAVSKFGGKPSEYIAEALKSAWAYEKKMVAKRAEKEAATRRLGAENIVEITVELPELVGSEKQIAWAKDIRAKYLEAVEEMNNFMAESKRISDRDIVSYRRKLGIFYLLSDNDDKDVTNPTEAVNKVLSNPNAGDIISTLKHLTK